MYALDGWIVGLFIEFFFFFNSAYFKFSRGYLSFPVAIDNVLATDD